MRNFSICIVCFLWGVSSLFASVEAVYLTLPQDPAHSILIHWFDSLNQMDGKVLYRKIDTEVWQKVPYTSKVFGGSSYFINTCFVTDLEPDTDYFFCVEGDKKNYRFRTVPVHLTRPLKIAIGGDLDLSSSLYHKMNLAVAKSDPDFVLLGGDIAYAYRKGVFVGKKDAVARWMGFLKEWSSSMVGKEGRMIAFATVIGNHDLSSLERKKQDMNCLFFQLFPPIDQRSYRTLDIANVISFFLLDTQHISPIAGKQSTWLEGALTQRREMPWKCAVYHIAGYPSVYNFAEKMPSLIRDHWVPIFEKHQVPLAFENHNHAFKRTHPILKGKVDPAGVVYMGDGAWGVSPRRSSGTRWYLAEKKQTNVFSLLTVEKDLLKVESFDNRSKLVDSWSFSKNKASL